MRTIVFIPALLAAFGLATQAVADDARTEKYVVDTLRASCASDSRDLHTCIDTMSKMTLVISRQIQDSISAQATSKNWEMALQMPIATMCHQPLQAQIDKKNKTAADYRALVARTSDCKREFGEFAQRKAVSSVPFPQARQVLDATLNWTISVPLLHAR